MSEKYFKKYSCEPNFVGYPLWYVVDGECWCHDCCNDMHENVDDDFIRKTSVEVNWEDVNLWCSQCCIQIESAYGEESEEESNDQTEDFDDPYIKAKE